LGVVRGGRDRGGEREPNQRLFAGWATTPEKVINPTGVRKLLYLYSCFLVLHPPFQTEDKHRERSKLSLAPAPTWGGKKIAQLHTGERKGPWVRIGETENKEGGEIVRRGGRLRRSGKRKREGGLWELARRSEGWGTQRSRSFKEHLS